MKQDDLYKDGLKFFIENSRYNAENVRGASEVFERNYKAEINKFIYQQFKNRNYSERFLTGLAKNIAILGPKQLALLMRLKGKPESTLNSLSLRTKKLNNFFLSELLKNKELTREHFKNILKRDSRMVNYLKKDYFSLSLLRAFRESYPGERRLSSTLDNLKELAEFLFSAVGIIGIISLAFAFLVLTQEFEVVLPMSPLKSLATATMVFYGGLYIILFLLENIQGGRLDTRHKKLLKLLSKLPEKEVFNL